MNHTHRIELDRRDPTYRSGEPVRGTLVIDSDLGTSCRSIHLVRYWRAHGRGEADRGSRVAMEIHDGPLEGPPPHRVPFEFEAPGGPFTYHGALLNLDHYVEARINPTGLFGPAMPEGFAVVPGERVDPPDPRLPDVTGKKASRGRGGCRAVAGAVMVIVGFFSLPFGLIVLIPGLFMVVPGLSRALAGARIGKVTSEVEPTVVRPGGTVEVQAHLRPKKPRTINSASATLEAWETVLSGEGRSRQAHVHRIHTGEVGLSGPRELTPGQDARLTAEIPIPRDAPLTFTSEHSEVSWEVTVSVDIPTWPDWHEVHKIVVWARELEEAEGKKEAALPAAPKRTEPGPAEPPPSPVEKAPPADASLGEAVSAILREKSFGGGRDPLIRELLGSRFTFELEVDGVEHTFGAGPDPRYRHGRTVAGTVAGTTVAVSVRFPAELNDEVDSYRRGRVETVSATAVDWEKLSETPVLEA